MSCRVAEKSAALGLVSCESAGVDDARRASAIQQLPIGRVQFGILARGLVEARAFRCATIRQGLATKGLIEAPQDSRNAAQLE